jgi:hypothetical protein
MLKNLPVDQRPTLEYYYKFRLHNIDSEKNGKFGTCH